MPAPVVDALLLRDTYRDSVELMRLTAALEQAPGVRRAAVLMGTPANRDLLAAAGLLAEPVRDVGPNDLVVAVAADDPTAAAAALARARALLAAESAAGPGAAEPARPRTVHEALAELPNANLAIISTPGPYATAEALKALKRGLHVFLFSANVPLEDEVELKQLARRKGLLCMGPDCGTAILDGVPLGFANAVRRGWIGIVGATGTGIQQVACLLDRLGAGVSQAIGCGGRDLDERVGGATMLAGIERLAADPATAALVLLSKPPTPMVARRVLDAASSTGKPVVACFLGGDPAVAGSPARLGSRWGALARAAGAVPAATLEDAAVLAVEVARGRPPDRGAPAGRSSRWGPRTGRAALARFHARALAPGQRTILGLYSGGTLATEAQVVLADLLGPEAALVQHRLLDLGAEEYTVGRPHPMIDPTLRNERIAAAGDDPSVAVLLLDVVLGYGAHPDPAGALVPAVREAQARALRDGRTLVVVASVCGTDADPQGRSRQEETLAAVGVVRQPSNAQAARFAAEVVLAAEGRL